MSLILLFLLLLILLFGVLVYFLKPTSMEKAVEEQLASLEGTQPVGGTSTNILKQETIRSGALEDLARWLPWSGASARLIKQAGRNWSIGSLTLISVAAGVVAYW